ncbi:DUF5686 family protein [Proteiniphilum sp.]|uniref:DUF5686 family protein n=1 Tax=Proteiniphilum sp. TaxID=1926877 RepID=UPI002B1FEC68|nr:DUF5686 family protein [Proteiniphilum sp.]MEA4916056.1 DUF5686 family protein [Proteiniphilum sp.]
MKGKVTVYILFLFITPLKSFALETELPVDTIMKRVMLAAERYNDLVESFSAEIYTRTYVETLKKNFLYKYTHLIPRFVLHDPDNAAAVIETISDLRFEHPNNYVQDIQHVTGTLTARKDLDMIPFELLNINIYGETTNDESFFMPLRFSTSKYYRYTLTRTFTENEKTYYSINFNPIYTNSKLLRGTFIIENGSWRVISFRGEGIDIFSDFSFEITMGDEWITLFLPVRFTIYETASYLGNVLASRHLATIKYKEMKMRRTTESVRSLNISDFYKIRLDSVPLQSDSTFWNEHRPIPLQAMERDVLSQYRQRQAEKAARKAGNDTLRSHNFAQQVQRVVMNSNYEYRSTAIGYSGLLNPLMVGYTSRDGITYRQKLFFNFDLKHNRTVKMNAFAGFMVRHKEFFTDLTSTWNYDPYRLGSATISIGNGNPTYSSLFVDQIQDSLNNRGINFEDISVKYYRDYYLKLYNTFEVTNGLLVQTGIDYHIRKSKNNMSKLRSSDNDSEPIEELFGTRKSFAPFIRISWTPQQYYRYDGRQKIYERSPFPTFKLELSRSFQNVLGSTSEYNRIEVDLSQNISFGLRHSLQYHVGAGKFINQKTEYFADFVYFSKNNFPENWNDGLGGIFNLLSRDLYNASDSYIQAHTMFEAPFLILKSIPFVSDFAENERIYVSQLYTPQIISYSELGYGIGNRFFNAGFFCSFHKTDFRQLGVRASFEF